MDVVMLMLMNSKVVCKDYVIEMVQGMESKGIQVMSKREKKKLKLEWKMEAIKMLGI